MCKWRWHFNFFCPKTLVCLFTQKSHLMFQVKSVGEFLHKKMHEYLKEKLQIKA